MITRLDVVRQLRSLKAQAQASQEAAKQNLRRAIGREKQLRKAYARQIAECELERAFGLTNFHDHVAFLQ